MALFRRTNEEHSLGDDIHDFEVVKWKTLKSAS